jgi:hypothetical protein
MRDLVRATLLGVVASFVSAGPFAASSSAGPAIPADGVPLPLEGRKTVRHEGKTYYVDGARVIPKGSAIRVEKDCRIVGVNGASLDVQGGFEVHGTVDHFVRIDGIDFGKTRKPETNFHFDMADLEGCRFVHGEGESFEGEWTIENSTLQRGCSVSVRLARGFFRLMTTEVRGPLRVEAMPTKGKPTEVSIRTSWIDGLLAVSGPCVARIQFLDLKGGFEAKDFTDLGVDGCDVHGGRLALVQGPEGSFSDLFLTKCNLFADARVLLDRPTGPKTKAEKVKIDKFHFGVPSLTEKQIADRIDDGADDPARSVRAFWTKPADRAHVFTSEALKMRIPPHR